MSSVIEDREFKQIKYVWILNLIPPASGIGLLYGCGSISFVLVLLCWAYLAAHFNLEAFFDVYMLFSILGTIGCVFHNLSLKNSNLIEEGYPDPVPKEIVASFDFDSDFQPEEAGSIELMGTDELGEGTSFFEKCKEQKLVKNANTSFEIEQSDNELDSPHMILLESNFENLVEIGSDIPSNLDESDDVGSFFQTNDQVKSRIDSDDSTAQDASYPEQSSYDELDDCSPQLKDDADTSVNQALSQDKYVATEFPSDSKVLNELETNSENNKLSDNQIDTKGEPKLVEQRKALLKKLGAATGEFQVETNGYEKFESSDSSFDPSTFDFNLPTSFESNFACMSATKDSGSVETEKDVVHCDCGSEINTSFSFCLTCGKIFS